MISRRTVLAAALGAAAFGMPAAAASVPQRLAVLDWALAELALMLGLRPIAVAEMALYGKRVGEPALPSEAIDVGLRSQPLTLSFASGEITGLIGQNGSGKSTLLKILARQYAPTDGVIRFEDRPLDRWGSRDFARRVAYLPQDPPSGTGLTASELVRLGRYPWHGAFGRFTEADAARAEDAMDLTDTRAIADRDVDTLSGGERQRVWLALLVAQDAGCILLDEPISALDVAHQIEVLDLIRRLGHERSLCVVVVLHDLNKAARFCDRIVALREGRLVANQSPTAFMTPSALVSVYGIAMEVLPRPGSPIGVAVPLLPSVDDPRDAGRDGDRNCCSASPGDYAHLMGVPHLLGAREDGQR